MSKTIDERHASTLHTYVRRYEVQVLRAPTQGSEDLMTSWAEWAAYMLSDVEEQWKGLYDRQSGSFYLVRVYKARPSSRTVDETPRTVVLKPGQWIELDAKHEQPKAYDESPYKDSGWVEEEA